MSNETKSNEFSTNVVTTAESVSQQQEEVNFSITPVQQLLASGSGALITSLLGKNELIVMFTFCAVAILPLFEVNLLI